MSKQRSAFEGVKRIAQFNWPMYAAAIFGIPFILCASAVFGRSAHTTAFAFSFLILLVVLASLIVSHWIYDRSPLYKWQWLKELVGSPQRICSFHAGYNEIGGMLAETFPTSYIVTVDFFEAIEHAETSLMVARRLYPESTPSISTDLRSSPVQNESIDLAIVCFAAHELRTCETRRLLFNELKRVMRPEAKAIIVEHLRDWRNLLVFGPGFLHFFGKDIWVSEIESAGLALSKFFRITPFVGVFVCTKS